MGTWGGAALLPSVGTWGGAALLPSLEPVGGRGSGQWSNGGNYGMAGLHIDLDTVEFAY